MTNSPYTTSIRELLQGELQESKHSYYRDGVEVVVNKSSIDLEYILNQDLESHSLDRVKAYSKLINTPLSPMSKTPYAKDYVTTSIWEQEGSIKRRVYNQEGGLMAKTPRGYTKQDLIVEELPIELVDALTSIEDLEQYVKVNSSKSSSSRATSGQLLNGLLAILSAIKNRHIEGVATPLPISNTWLKGNYGLNDNSIKLIKGTKLIKEYFLLDVDYRFNSTTKSAYGRNGNKIKRTSKAMSITPTTKLIKLLEGATTKVGIWSKVLKDKRESKVTIKPIAKPIAKPTLKVVSKGAKNKPSTRVLRGSISLTMPSKVGIEGVQELLEGLDAPIDHLDQACLDGGINVNTTTLACKGDNLIDNSIDRKNINSILSYAYGNLDGDRKLKNLVNKYLRYYRNKGSYNQVYREDKQEAIDTIELVQGPRETLRECLDSAKLQLKRVELAREIASKRIKNRK